MIALERRLYNERERLGAARNSRERDLRAVLIAQIEREIGDEREFLGGAIPADIAALSDDDLLDALGAP